MITLIGIILLGGSIWFLFYIMWLVTTDLSLDKFRYYQHKLQSDKHIFCYDEDDEDDDDFALAPLDPKPRMDNIHLVNHYYYDR